jgi:hypothetical protein
MKKSIWIIVVLLTVFSFSLSAETNLDSFVQSFLNKGSYILVKKNSRTTYYPKHIIAQLSCEDNEVKMIYIDEEFDYDTISFNSSKDSITIDENGNIIVNK